MIIETIKASHTLNCLIHIFENFTWASSCHETWRQFMSKVKLLLTEIKYGAKIAPWSSSHVQSFKVFKKTLENAHRFNFCLHIRLLDFWDVFTRYIECFKSSSSCLEMFLVMNFIKLYFLPPCFLLILISMKEREDPFLLKLFQFKRIVIIQTIQPDSFA